MIKQHNQKHDSKVQTSYFELMQLFATNLCEKFILINPSNLNSTPNPKTAKSACAGIQFYFQIWSSSFNGLDLNSYPTLDTSVKYTLYTSKFLGHNFKYFGEIQNKRSQST